MFVLRVGGMFVLRGGLGHVCSAGGLGHACSAGGLKPLFKGPQKIYHLFLQK